MTEVIDQIEVGERFRGSNTDLCTICTLHVYSPTRTGKAEACRDQSTRDAQDQKPVKKEDFRLWLSVRSYP